MSFKKILFFFSFFLFALIVNGQEDILIQSAGEDPLQGNLQENVDQVFELEAIPENKAKKKKKEKKMEGCYINGLMKNVILILMDGIILRRVSLIFYFFIHR